MWLDWTNLDNLGSLPTLRFLALITSAKVAWLVRERIHRFCVLGFGHLRQGRGVLSEGGAKVQWPPNEKEVSEHWRTKQATPLIVTKFTVGWLAYRETRWCGQTTQHSVRTTLCCWTEVTHTLDRGAELLTDKTKEMTMQNPRLLVVFWWTIT